MSDPPRAAGVADTAAAGASAARLADTATADARALCSRRAHVGDTIGVAVVALLLYVLLGQDKLYKVDGHYLLLQSHGGDLRHPFHPLYLLGLAALKTVTSAFGISLYRAGVLYSALGTAAAIGLMHAASRMVGMSRRAAAATAALVASAPAVVFFATVVEVHGPFLAYAGICCLAAAWLWRRADALAAVVFGACTATAALAHATGHLLPIALLPLLVAWPRDRAAAPSGAGDLAPAGDSARRAPSPRRRWTLVALALATHAAASALLPLGLVALGLMGGAGRSFAALLAYLRAQWSAPAPLATVWHEWLWPFLPLSAVWLPALARRGERLLGAGLLVALLAYLVAAATLLGGDREFGAYLLPLAWPAALLTVRTLQRLPRRPPLWAATTIALVAASLSLGVTHVARHDQAQQARAFAAGLREITRGEPAFLLIGGYAELEACFVALPEVPFKVLIEESKMDPSLLPQALPAFDLWLAGWQVQHAVFLTNGGADYLRDPYWTPTGPSGPLLLAHLQQSYRLEPVAAGAFVAHRVLPR